MRRQNTCETCILDYNKQAAGVKADGRTRECFSKLDCHIFRSMFTILKKRKMSPKLGKLQRHKNHRHKSFPLCLSDMSHAFLRCSFWKRRVSSSVPAFSLLQLLLYRRGVVRSIRGGGEVWRIYTPMFNYLYFLSACFQCTLLLVAYST